MEYKTSKETISGIQKNIEFYLDPLRNPVANYTFQHNTTLKTDLFAKLDDLLYDVFCRLQRHYIAINGHVLKTIGLKTANEIGLDEFNVSNGWLDKFGKRHKLDFKTISGEVKSAD